MDKKTAKKILDDSITEDQSLYCLGKYLSWHNGDEEACLDGDFTIDELEAIVWWMKNN